MNSEGMPGTAGDCWRLLGMTSVLSHNGGRTRSGVRDFNLASTLSPRASIIVPYV